MKAIRHLFRKYHPVCPKCHEHGAQVMMTGFINNVDANGKTVSQEADWNVAMCVECAKKSVEAVPQPPVTI